MNKKSKREDPILNAIRARHRRIRRLCIAVALMKRDRKKKVGDLPIDVMYYALIGKMAMLEDIIKAGRAIRDKEKKRQERAMEELQDEIEKMSGGKLNEQYKKIG